jgi:hypothetical protein
MSPANASVKGLSEAIWSLLFIRGTVIGVPLVIADLTNAYVLILILCYSDRHMAPRQVTPATRLEEILDELGIPKWRFAQTIGKPEATVNRWMKGLTPRADNQAIIIAALNDLGEVVDAEDLWGIHV